MTASRYKLGKPSTTPMFDLYQKAGKFTSDRYLRWFYEACYQAACKKGEIMVKYPRLDPMTDWHIVATHGPTIKANKLMKQMIERYYDPQLLQETLNAATDAALHDTINKKYEDKH